MFRPLHLLNGIEKCRLRLGHDPIEKHHSLHLLRHVFGQRHRYPTGVRYRQRHKPLHLQLKQQLLEICQQILCAKGESGITIRQGVPPPVEADHPILLRRQCGKGGKYGFWFTPTGQQDQRQRA
ncbi:hypothetical protein D3C71_1493540 [compost metagenome]